MAHTPIGGLLVDGEHVSHVSGCVLISPVVGTAATAVAAEAEVAESRQWACVYRFLLQHAAARLHDSSKKSMS